MTLFLNWSDKKRAQADEWRIKEATLHLVEFIGGWPTAYITQRVIRHKTSKMSYQVWFWVIVVVHQVASFDYLRGGIWTHSLISSVGFILARIVESLLALRES